MVEQHAELALGARLEVGNKRCEVVGTVQRFDDDAEVAEVVAPDVFEEFGVVLALDPDPAGTSDSRSTITGDGA